VAIIYWKKAVKHEKASPVKAALVGTEPKKGEEEKEASIVKTEYNLRKPPM
jgi:hypothetical protein